MKSILLNHYEIRKLSFSGHSAYGTEVQNYKPIQGGATCSITPSPTCTAVNITSLDWYIHGHHTYYFSIKVTNTAGLAEIQVSSPYIHDVQLPAEGVVLDIDTQVRNMCPIILNVKLFCLNVWLTVYL